MRAIIGTGAYRITDLLAPQRLDAERFDRWWGATPDIARVSYLAVGRGETRAAMAEAGQAEIVTTLAPETVGRLRRNPRLDVQVVPIPRTRAIKLNCRLPMFADASVRRAVSLAIDRAGIAQALLRSPESAATQLFPAGLADWHDGTLPPLARDLAQARRLLDAAGWRPGPDGIRAKDGRAFRVTLRTFTDRPELPGIASRHPGPAAGGRHRHGRGHRQQRRDPGRASRRNARDGAVRAQLLPRARSLRHGGAGFRTGGR